MIVSSNLPPLRMTDPVQQYRETLARWITKSEFCDISIGYVSRESLIELDRLAREFNTKIRLTLGMYFSEGMPEPLFHQLRQLSEEWEKDEVGEIRLVLPFKYHGKTFVFYKDGQPAAAVCGSGNLSVLKPVADTLRSYEVGVLVEEGTDLQILSEFAQRIASSQISKKISDVESIRIVKERNRALDDFELAAPIPPNNVKYFKKQKSEFEFKLPLKVPKYEERLLDDGKHYTKSNINVCYAAPRSKTKNRDWYEMQLTVGAEIYKRDGYPKRNEPFFITTDDGFMFKAHTTSDNNKQFSAVGDELLMGRWLKGRLEAAGLTKAVNNIGEDSDRQGMITMEMLEKYGCTELLFRKTDKKSLDENGNSLDVWYLSFDPEDMKE
ncbi:MAG: NgoFVII family restriction endonuclease [Erysipelotrichaceae bacterium]|nr:NgoFVII family restriction endonuclease [Erysipelotrichaceae bacterium]